jgi:osmotically-inducible protein OsmY
MKGEFENLVTPRADAEIFSEARRALDRRHAVPPEVHVHGDQGVVTLTGSGRSGSERAEAYAAVAGIAGIRRIINAVVVAPPPDVVT